MEHESKRRRIHRTTAAERSRIVERFSRSGLSRIDFARKHGLAISTFQRWMAIERRESQDLPPQRFSEVKLLPSFPTASWAVEMVSPSGITIRFRDLPPIEALARMLGGKAC